MAAQPDMFAHSSGPAQARRGEPEPRRSALVLPLRSIDANGLRLIEQTSGDRLGPARGVLLGLALGAALWAGIGVLAWEILRYSTNGH